MGDLTLTYFLLFFLFAACSIPFFVMARKRKFDAFEIIYWASAYFWLIFFLRSLYLLKFGSEFLGKPPFSAQVIRAWNISLLYLTVAFLLFLVGYYSRIAVAIANSLPSLPKEWSARKAKVLIPLFVAIGTVSYYVLFQYLGGFSYYLSHKSEALTAMGTSYLNFGIAFMAYSLTIGLIIALRYKKYVKTTVLILFPLTLYMGFLRGSKGAFLSPIFIAIIMFHYLKKRAKIRYLVLFCLVVVVLTPVLLANRAGVSVPDALAAMTTQPNWMEFIHIFMLKFHVMDSMIYIVRDTPEVMDYQLGKTILPLFVSWVPRQLWEDKPIICFGRTFGETYYKDFFGGTGTAPSASIIGEAYINFHVGGILWASLLFGIMLRLFYQYLIKDNFGATGVFIYATIFLSLVMAWEADCATIASSMILSLILLLFMSSLIAKRPVKSVTH